MGQHHDPDDGGRCRRDVGGSSGCADRDRERAEELERDGEAESDAVDGGVEAEIHDAERRGQAEHRAPLLPGHRPEARPCDRGQDERGDQLAHRDHPDRPQCRERQSTDRRPGLVGDRAAHCRGYTGSALARRRCPCRQLLGRCDGRSLFLLERHNSTL
ncbi:hypothetical protein LWC35_16735 [Pseudonocardia kujensis]|nr:hypothetical protein [Pseudonocardia kujensis]